jgi:glutamine synthetase
MEQQYTLMKLGALGADKQPILGATDGKYKADDATWYCSRNVDKDMAKIREFSETHYSLCLVAGVKIQSGHIGRTLSSGSFTIGPCRGLNIGDHLVAARWLCGVVDERFKDFFCSFDPLPAGAGGPGKALYTSFSSRQTRNEGGSQILEKCARALARENKKHLPAYGEGNDERLDGSGRNPAADTFTYAVSDRTASVMIPRNVAVTGRGDLVDRRVGSNADPYRVAGVMMSTMAICLKQASLKELGANQG